MTIQIIDNVSNNDLIEIEKILVKNDLSTYSLDKKDFIIAKEWTKIIWCWRIYKIPWESIYELSSVWVDPEYRWNKLGITICNELLKKNSNTILKWLYLATKVELGWYYRELWFVVIHSNIPDKFLVTLKWAKQNNIDAIVMKKENI